VRDGPDAVEQRVEVEVEQVALDQAEPLVAQGVLQVPLLGAAGVVAGKGVHADYLAAPGEQTVNQVRTYKPRGARYEDAAHGVPLIQLTNHQPNP
jgi:hypothetical protein